MMNTKNLQHNKHPHMLFILTLLEFSIRFTSWGIISTIVLYSVAKLAFDYKTAYLIQGTFISMPLALSVIGGYIADKIIGFRKSLLSGLFFQTLGMFFLALMNKEMAFVGLSFIIVGFGLTFTNTASYLSLFYLDDNNKRTGGFAILYAAINVGALLGPVIYGYTAKHFSYEVAFVFNGSLLLVMFIIFYLCKYIVPLSEEKFTILNKLNYGQCLLSGLVCFLLIALLFYYPNYTFFVLLISLICAIVYLTFQKLYYSFTLKLDCILFLLIFTLAYFSFELQVNNSLITFIGKYINRHVLSTEIPAASFVAFQPLLVIIFTPFINYFRAKIVKNEFAAETFKQITIALILETFAFVIFYFMACAAHKHMGLLSLVWILNGYSLLAIGELFLMPPAIAYLTRISTNELKGTIIGFFYLSIAMSSYLAGYIASLTVNIPFAQSSNKNSYSVIYFDIIILASIFIILAIFITLFYYKKNEPS